MVVSVKIAHAKTNSAAYAVADGTKMRISDISNWTTCEAMALESPPRTAGRTNVASHVGTLAHAKLAGITPALPGRLAFDTLTPSSHHANVQSDAIAACARDLMQDQGWTPIAHEEELRRDELVGHLDIRAWHSDHGEAIIDLKTGQGVGAAWLQVGGYADLWRNGGPAPSTEEFDAMKWGGVLHVPRVAISKDVKGTLEFRPISDLRMAWDASMDRISSILGDGFKPTYSPGIHCTRCGVADCPVRVGERK